MVSTNKIFNVTILTCISFIVLFISCRKNKNEQLPSFTSFDMKIKDDKNNLVDGAELLIFDNYNDYLNCLNSPNYSFITGALASGVTVNGKVLLDSLPSKRSYYMLAYIANTQLLPGFTIYYDNSEGTNTVPFKPENSSAIQGTIILRPIEGVLTFWTTYTQVASNSIKVVVGDNQPNNLSINQSFPGRPAPSEPYSVKMRRGTYKYYGLSSKYCTWTGEASVVPGTSSFVELPTCVAGAVSFYSSDNSQSLFPVEITLGLGIKTDTIFGTSQVGGCNINSANVKNMSLPVGKYSYFAKSLKTNCAWSGEINIVDNSCLEIDLKKCR